MLNFNKDNIGINIGIDMNTYNETKEGTTTKDGMNIPMVVGNRHYDMILAEVEAGEAEVVAYAGSDKEADEQEQEKQQQARSWRDTELALADIDVKKDDDGMQGPAVGLIRAWRVRLRNWPDTGSFPDNKPSKNY